MKSQVDLVAKLGLGYLVRPRPGYLLYSEIEETNSCDLLETVY